MSVTTPTNEPLQVAALTQGATVPSTRFRVLQHLPFLAAAGIDVTHLTARLGSYAPHAKWRRAPWLVGTLVDAVRRARAANRAQVCLLQRELVATLATAERLIRRPFVFDVDDAIFMFGSRSRMTDRIARRAAVICCGNNFLADHYRPLGPVTILPTAVDTERFRPGAAPPTGRVIGWSGTSPGFAYLYAIEEALEAVMRRHPDVIFRVIAERKPEFRKLPAERVEYHRWSAETEVAMLQGLSIGLMPLFDDAQARGKCSFKMLTYMAAGLPVVVSPFGMNGEVLAHGTCGFGPKSIDEWVHAISTLLSDPALGAAMGRTGRALVEERYSRRIVGPRLAAVIRLAAAGRDNVDLAQL